MTYTEAAAKAGFSKKFCHIYGPKLMNSRYFPKVVERVRQMKEQLAIRTDLTFESHVNKMAEIRDAAMDKGNFTAAVAAEKSRGQAAGFYVSRSEVMVGKIDQMSRDEVMAEIKRIQTQYPSLLSMTAATVIDAVPNNEVTYAEIDTADNRSQDVEVNAGQDEDRGSMDEA
jgi:phage terminase small subunit